MRIPFLAIAGIGFWSLAPKALAFQITVHQSVCQYVPCFAGGGSAGLVAFLMAKFIPSMYVVFGAVAGIYLLKNAITMVIKGMEEGEAAEARGNIINIITGCVVVGISGFVVQSFAVGYGLQVVNPAPISTALGNVILFFKLVVAAAAMANLVIQAFRIISSQGDSGMMEKGRKRLIMGFVGIGIILLANVIISATVPGAGSAMLSAEVVGIANFLITLVGALCVVAMILAGIAYVISVDESYKDSAKTAIKVSIVTLVIMLLSYAIVNTFLSLG